MDFKYFLMAIVMCGVAWAQDSLDQSEVFKKLPPNLQNQLNNTDVEAVKNKTQELFKEKCEKNGAPDTFARAQEAYQTFPTCVKESLGLDDPDKLKSEIEEAKHRGAVDEVFKKYCDKRSAAKQCFTDALESVRKCFTEEEQNNLKTVSNITEQLAEFVCFKDGDRIALFIAEGGPECFNATQSDIQECFGQTFGGDFNFDTSNITANAIPDIAFGEEECNKLTKLQLCVVGKLESCKGPTTANIAESLFKFIRKATPCKEVETKKSNSATSLSMTSTAILLAVVTAIY